MKTFLALLFILNISHSYGQESFLKACSNESFQVKSIKNDLKWLKAFYKTKDCAVIAQKISQLKSLSEIILPFDTVGTKTKYSWTDQFPYLYGIFDTPISVEVLQDIEIDIKNTFLDLTLYRDFKNIIHIPITRQYSFTYRHSICEILKLFPNLKVVSIEQDMIEYGNENDECLAQSKLDGIIIRGRFYDFNGKVPKTKIIGIENYASEFKHLIKYPNLAYLGISNSTTSQGSLEELSERINITHFSMNINTIKGISNLENLVNLTYLSLSCIDDEDEWTPSHCKQGSYLKNINFLKKLRWLKDLKLNYHELVDISPIENLKYLETVEARGNNIIKIPTFKNLTKLTFLDISGNKIQDLFNIQDLKSLQYLDVSSNRISDFSDISGLEKLIYLNLSNNLFQTSLDTFIPPASLKVLALNGSSPDQDQDNWASPKTDFVDETMVSSLQLFEKIMNGDFEVQGRVYTPFVSEEINLRSFSNLEVLVMRNNNFKNIPKLHYLNKLKYLDLDGNKIKTVPTNLNLSELRILDLSANHLEHLPALHQFPKIKKIDLTANRIKALNKFKTPHSLSIISLRRNLLTDIRILGKPMYKDLKFDLEENPVVDKKTHCPLKSPNKSLNWYCNVIVNKPDDAEQID